MEGGSVTEIAKGENLDRQKLRGVGMTFWLNIEGVPASGTSKVPPKLIGALIDTGAEISSISEEVARYLNDTERSRKKVYTPLLGHREEDALKCKITFLEGTMLTLEMPIVKELEPYEVLIGRDLLTDMKLEADFKNGSWKLTWA